MSQTNQRENELYRKWLAAVAEEDRGLALDIGAELMPSLRKGFRPDYTRAEHEAFLAWMQKARDLQKQLDTEALVGEINAGCA